MRISNILAAALLAAATVSADDITLSGGNARLSGTVRSIGDTGVVELDCPHASEPLLLKAGSVDKVAFSPPAADPGTPPAALKLVNGDLLPGRVESLDETRLVFSSPVTGRLEIPRAALASLQLGVRSHKLIYSGPGNLEEWTTADADMKNWIFENGGLVANGTSVATRSVEFPQQFILRFTLKWQARANPNFEVYFADPLKDKGEACDRYFLRFNSAGFEIKRESSRGKRYQTVALLNRTPNQYPGRELDVELRVNRKGSRMQVFLNREPEGEYADPGETPPTGKGITLVCHTQNGNPQTIANIEVLEFDDSSVRHRTEERGDLKSDGLISRDDDRWGGRLLEIRARDGGSLFRFKSDFQDEPLEIPDTDVSTVFFASGEAAGPEEKPAPFVIRLRDHGSLRVSSCRFDGDSVSAVHPLLGALSFKRDGLTVIEWAAAKPAPES